MIIIAVAAICVIGFLVYMARGEGTRDRFVQREPISDQEYLHQLQAEARGMRCPHPGYKGTREPCKRAAGRPCAPGCTGRRNISTRWDGK